METQTQIKTICNNCSHDLVVPTITDCRMTFQTAAAKCECGWEQSGRQLKSGFIADNPVGYYNLKS